MQIFNTIEDLRDHLGSHFAVSEWFQIDQKRVNLFAEATGDFQWIHIDVERARGGPYGGTIAHGFLTLSMLPQLTASAMKFQRVEMGLNYGLNKVRFPAPLKVGSQVRASFKLISLNNLPAINEMQGFEILMEVIVESSSGGKPVCVAETISRRYQRSI